jgi:hypothetical protein
MAERKKQSLDFPAGADGAGMLTGTIQKQVENSFLEKRLAVLYPEFISAKDTEDAYSIMASVRKPSHAVLEKYIPATSKEKTPGESFAGIVQLTYSSYNRLVFETSASKTAVLCLNYPWSENWKVTRDSAESQLYRTNGAYLGIEVPAGTSTIEFKYKSWSAHAGMIISCSVSMILGALWWLGGAKKTWHHLAGAGWISVPFLIYLAWNQSLYNGANLQTNYSWPTPFHTTPLNLAFGKRTGMISPLLVDRPDLFASGSAVDGSSDSRWPAITDKKDPNPWWLVDLHIPANVGGINVYAARQGQTFNPQPLVTAFSMDGRTFVDGAVLQRTAETNFSAVITPPITARYVMVRGTGQGQLALDEVEILPP